MLNGTTFGFVNGIITMLSLITGMYATRVNRIGIIGAIMAMLISDPLCDSYAIYIAQRESNDSDDVKNVAISSFISQVSLQAVFLLIIMLIPNLKHAVYTCYLFGIGGTISYGVYKNSEVESIIKNLIGIAILVSITYFIDRMVYKFFK